MKTYPAQCKWLNKKRFIEVEADSYSQAFDVLIEQCWEKADHEDFKVISVGRTEKITALGMNITINLN